MLEMMLAGGARREHPIIFAAANISSSQSRIYKLDSRDMSVVGQFDWDTEALSMCYGPGDFLYVGFTGPNGPSSTLVKIDPDTMNEVGSLAGRYQGICSSVDGFLYGVGSNVDRINTNTMQVVSSFTGASSGVGVSICSDPDGYIYSLSRDETVRKINSNMDQVASYTRSFSSSQSKIGYSEGFIYLATNARTYRLNTSDLSETSESSLTNSGEAKDVAAAPGYMCVATNANERLIRYGPSGGVGSTITASAVDDEFIEAVSYSGNGVFYAASDGGRILTIGKAPFAIIGESPLPEQVDLLASDKSIPSLLDF